MRHSTNLFSVGEINEWVVTSPVCVSQGPTITVEIWLSILVRKLLKRGRFYSLDDFRYGCSLPTQKTVADEER